MSDYFVPGVPPKWVPGPYREPATPNPYTRPMAQPSWRFVDVPVLSTLGEIAMRFYKNPSDAMRIFNDNRAGSRMPDGTLGQVDSPNDTIQPGTRIWLS